MFDGMKFRPKIYLMIFLGVSFISLMIITWILKVLTSPSSSVQAVFPSPWKLKYTIPRDPSCFTQGLEFLNQTILAHSCGLYGESKVELLDFSKYDIDSRSAPEIIRTVRLQPQLFAEGITLANNELYLITWREKVLVVFDRDSLSVKRHLSYPLNGWGLVYRPSTSTFLASDGSDKLYHLVINDTGVIIQRIVSVVCNGQPIPYINELELVDNDLYANVWQTNYIYKFNPDTGICLSFYNLEGLKKGSGEVLNGIANRIGIQDRPNHKSLWVTGKQWEYLHYIEFSF